jgi:hypothetical protein
MTDGIARIGKVIDHAIDKFLGTILETRKGYNQTVFLYNASGDDSVPCKNDKVIILKVDGTGNFIGAGILTETQGAKPGEKIFFGRDASGKITSKLSMLNDGTMELKNKGDTVVETEKNLSVTIKGDITIEGEGAINETGGGDTTKEAAGKYTIHGKEILIEGDTELVLKTIGSALWCPNGVTNCFICGAPHGGAAMGIQGLKGA